MGEHGGQCGCRVARYQQAEECDVDGFRRRRPAVGELAAAIDARGRRCVPALQQRVGLGGMGHPAYSRGGRRARPSRGPQRAMFQPSPPSTKVRKTAVFVPLRPAITLIIAGQVLRISANNGGRAVRMAQLGVFRQSPERSMIRVITLCSPPLIAPNGSPGAVPKFASHR